MGWYINVPQNRNKAQQLIDLHSARRCTFEEARTALGNANIAPICVVENGYFDAAALIFSESELRSFSDPDDLRPRTWMLMDREKAEVLSGYKQPTTV